jgi:E3 ubiquitin-protein ligase XBAT32/33
VADTKAKGPAAAVVGDDKAVSSPRLSRRRSRRSREGSSSFKGLSSAMGSLSSKIGRGSGRLAGDSAFLDKLEHDLP